MLSGTATSPTPAQTAAFPGAALARAAEAACPDAPVGRARRAAGVAPMQDDFYDLSPEDVAQARMEWIRTGQDWFAHAYDLAARADLCAARIARLCSRHSRAGRLFGQFCALPWRYERAALTAQAHQAYALAVATRKGRDPHTQHDPDVFRPDPALMARAHAILFRRINIAHGHGALYRGTPD